MSTRVHADKEASFLHKARCLTLAVGHGRSSMAETHRKDPQHASMHALRIQTPSITSTQTSSPQTSVNSFWYALTLDPHDFFATLVQGTC